MSHFEVRSFSGSSMHPTLSAGDRLKIESRSLHCGDIVLYRDQFGEWICHRMVVEQGDYFFIQGDANTTGEWVEKKSVWGVVSGVERGGRFFLPPSTFLVLWICRYQLLIDRTSSRFLKKIYRGIVRFFLICNKFFSNS